MADWPTGVRNARYSCPLNTASDGAAWYIRAGMSTRLGQFQSFSLGVDHTCMAKAPSGSRMRNAAYSRPRNTASDGALKPVGGRMLVAVQFIVLSVEHAFTADPEPGVAP